MFGNAVHVADAFALRGRTGLITGAGPIGAMAHGGRVAALGLPDREVPVGWSAISLRMLTIQGISGRKVFDTWHTMASRYDEGLDPTFTVTHHFAAEEYEKAFATAAEGTAGKVILDWVPRD